MKEPKLKVNRLHVYSVDLSSQPTPDDCSLSHLVTKACSVRGIHTGYMIRGHYLYRKPTKIPGRSRIVPIDVATGIGPNELGTPDANEGVASEFAHQLRHEIDEIDAADQLYVERRKLAYLERQTA